MGNGYRRVSASGTLIERHCHLREASRNELGNDIDLDPNVVRLEDFRENPHQRFSVAFEPLILLLWSQSTASEILPICASFSFLHMQQKESAKQSYIAMLVDHYSTASPSPSVL